MNFPEALGAALSARFRVPEIRTPATQRRGLQARMGALVKAHGGDYKRAAASAGIPERTWRDWRSGRHPPSAKSLRRLEGAYARQIIRPAATRMLANAKKAVKAIHVHAVVVADPRGRRYKNSQPDRQFRAEKIPAERVVTAWMTLGPEAAAQQYEALVAEQYGQQFAFEGDNVSVDLLP